jgi:hypothetical protein
MEPALVFQKIAVRSGGNTPQCGYSHHDDFDE